MLFFCVTIGLYCYEIPEKMCSYIFHAHGPLYYCSRSRTTTWWIFLRASPYASLVPETTPPHIVANQGGWQRGCTCGKNTGSPTVNGDGILPTPVSPLLLPFPLPGARTRVLPSRLPASMMVSSLLLTSPPFFLPLLPAGARALSLRARVRLNNFFYTCFSLVTLDPWDASPFLFSPTLSPVFSIFSSSVTCPRVSSYSSPPSYPVCTSCVTSLSSEESEVKFFTIVKSHNVLCHVLS